ncbi:RxLR effector protein [Phytophthora megakarya]|uniref:RxLR effector protein n=1 Tax=Phytophthora megakarya TaxID=4795 RepID=A0A225VUF9_9STRA|nr:RxLR effector protein [Phytophthora megakarya]
MRLGWALVMTMSALLACAGVLSATVEGKQIKTLYDENGARIHHGNLGRSLRVTKASDENENATGEKDLTLAEERISFITNVKHGFWEMFGVSTATAKKRIGIPANVYGPALANEKKFPEYLSYVNRKEKNRMWEDAHRHIPTTEYWLAMEKQLGPIDSLQRLNEIKNTNAFRFFKRYAQKFDASMVSVMRSGYHDPKYYGNDYKKATNMIEWGVRAEIWGKNKIEPSDVNKWLKDAKGHLKDEDIQGIWNIYSKYYTPGKQPTLLQMEAAEKAELEKFILRQAS